ncbi:bifunctional 2-polyprenyl-6-hydroxyphenol methylase/3-demethylubiquinol 3-O-methyltransferase UbiG [Ostreibacterium oceani]|uniref:Ubiquinone biosynthesis O-methyltransferase n=1 Tax=Ostreibacterium oceani TaxID=2654998 RepID=A0A6N7EXK8_9GAMM|nr:bifunctional 2-polyprenyl-6-hydroxyphenol methylase/3-demethylubiquinol 3-O-methyltransferase UbiG [Ostreibacterium oceani]MPV86683.1 bifunctional 2-polyprenyl-6-hydroxyphenol methylase/3-demethylubiquinol 3-O-methyltransferase UbiG [Ostreibacterium oceani]
MNNTSHTAVSPHTQSEINKFNALADEFWAHDGPFKALHQINPIRLTFLQSLTPIANQAIIDIGCGGGILSESLDQLGANVTGIDVSDQVINAAKHHQQQTLSRVNYRCISTTDFIAENPPAADIVCCLEMLEHVENPSQIIHDCANLTKPGGVLLFSTINRTRKAQLLAIGMAEYVLGMVPKGTHDYRLFIRPSEMRRMAEDAGLAPVAIRGIRYRPLQRDFVESQDTDINYLFAFKKT